MKIVLIAVLLLMPICAEAKEWKGIVVHHSATSSGTVESFRRYHMDTNGWVDIGYNFVIYRDGTIHEGRPLTIDGAHAPGYNKTHIGICLVGNDSFTAEQIATLKKFVKDWNLVALRHHKKCPGPGIDVESLN